MIHCYRYVIFSYADSGMSNTLEVEEEEEVFFTTINLKILRDTILNIWFSQSSQGGLESLVTGFHSSRIQYGLVGVETPKGRKVSALKTLWKSNKMFLQAHSGDLARGGSNPEEKCLCTPC